MWIDRIFIIIIVTIIIFFLRQITNILKYFTKIFPYLFSPSFFRKPIRGQNIRWKNMHTYLFMILIVRKWFNVTLMYQYKFCQTCYSALMIVAIVTPHDIIIIIIINNIYYHHRRLFISHQNRIGSVKSFTIITGAYRIITYMPNSTALYE